MTREKVHQLCCISFPDQTILFPICNLKYMLKYLGIHMEYVTNLFSYLSPSNNPNTFEKKLTQTKKSVLKFGGKCSCHVQIISI